MPRGARPHRLPQRLDYAIIPAPLDLSLPLAEKSPLPAVIVTPSSPTHERDFGIAFLAPEPPASASPSSSSSGSYPRLPLAKRFRLRRSTPAWLQLPGGGAPSSPVRARTLLLALFLFVVFACHLWTRRFAAARAAPPRVVFVAQAPGDADLHAPDGAGLWGLLAGVARKAGPPPAAGEGAADGAGRDYVAEAFPGMAVVRE